MQPPSSTSPRLNRSTPGRPSPGPKTFSPPDRSLPSREVSAATITDAYVAFILYCNPHFPLDVETTTLQANFNSLPKSDNREFESYPLFQLIQKLDAKEIKTWSQLALELGVDAPDLLKGKLGRAVRQCP